MGGRKGWKEGGSLVSGRDGGRRREEWGEGGTEEGVKGGK